MEPPLWKLVRDGKGTMATHAALAAAVKHSRLLGDFLQFVVAEQYRLFSPTLSHRHFADYLETCRERDPEMQQWSESTCERLRSSIFQILAQAGYIDSTRGISTQLYSTLSKGVHWEFFASTLVFDEATVKTAIRDTLLLMSGLGLISHFVPTAYASLTPNDAVDQYVSFRKLVK